MNRGVWRAFKAGLPEDLGSGISFTDFQEFSDGLDLSPRRALRAFRETLVEEEDGSEAEADFAAAKGGKKGGGSSDGDAPTDDAPTDDSPTDGGSAKGGKGGGKGKPTKPEPDPEPEPDPDPEPEPDPDPVGNTPDSAGVYASYTSGIGDAGFVSDFNVALSFGAGWTADLQSDILRAAEYVSALVTGDLADLGPIDDIAINIGLVSIDGTNGTAARGAATGFRADGTAYQGLVQFDTADIQTWSNQSRLDDLAVHEMLHAMGFGVRWDAMGLLGSAGGTTRFTGDNAIAAWESEFAAVAANDAYSDQGVPVEMDGGAGTAEVHWDEMTFFDELMTGYLGGDNYMSATSVAALEDMGYETVFDAADPTAPILQIDEILLA